MNNKFFVFLGLILFSLATKAQTLTDPTVMTINGNPVSKSEFEYVYKKNNTESSIEKKSLAEYVDLFTDFKLKIEEAKALGLDTARQFIKEFTGYKDQLIQPYLLDTVTEQAFAKDLYGRLNENIEVSHILFKFDKPQVFPSDTLELYKKAMAVRARLVGKKAEPFDKVAKEVSDDPSAKMASKGGYLGWTTGMMFIAPFEDAMYGLKVNEISMPVRTAYGYHLIKVENKRPDLGMVDVAHIMFGFSQQEPSKEEVDSIQALAKDVYAKLKSGGDYAQLCTQYSADKQSAANGGDLGWFGVEARLPDEFKTASYALKDTGDFTQPIKTAFGYHIIKLINKKPRATWDEAKTGFMNQIKRSDRQTKLTKLYEEALVKQFDYKLDTVAYNNLNVLATTVFPTDSLFLDKTANDNKTLFTVNGSAYKVSDFGHSITKAGQSSNLSTELLQNAYVNYLYSVLKEKQKENLVASNSDIKNLVQEYHDGILLFNIMNEQVWEKATNDTLGLQKYFAENKAKYTWSEPKFKGFVLFAKDADAKKKAETVIKKNKKSNDLIANLKEAFSTDSIPPIKVERGLWAKGENAYVDYQIVNKGKGTAPAATEKFPLFVVNGKFITAPEDYTDVKGLVVSDYQDWLEKEWLASLRAKYPVTVNQDVLKTIR